jgi:HK97 family phage major capsid protein
MASMYKVLLEERTNLVAEGKRLFEAADAEARGLTDDEKGRDDAINARLGVIAEDLAREEKRRERERVAAAVTFDGNITGQRDLAAERPFASLGEQLQAVRSAYQAGAMPDPRLLRINALPLGLSVGAPSDGGFLMQSDFVASLWQRAYDQGVILNRTFKVPIGDLSDSVKIPAVDETSRVAGSRWGGVRQYWVAGAGTITASSGHVRQIELAPKKEGVLMYATSEMLRNPLVLEAMVNAIVPQELVFGAENAIFAGDGAGKPMGILASPCLVTVAAEGAQLAATIVIENISKMWSRMWAPSRRNAVWLINQDVEPQFDAMALTVGMGGMPAYLPAGGFSAAPYGTLKGRPVIPVEYASTLGTVGDIVLADLSQYVTADRGGVQAASSIHVQFLTDQTAFRFLYEIDGQPWWNAPLTPHSASANTLSPFVALATRA